MYKQLRDEFGNIDNACILRLADSVAIPFDASNRDYQQYLEDTENGTINVEPADPVPPPGVQDIARQYIRNQNLREKYTTLAQQADNALASMSTNITDAQNATTLAQMRSAVVSFMQTSRVFHERQKDTAIETLQLMLKFLQVFDMTDDDDATNGTTGAGR